MKNFLSFGCGVNSVALHIWLHEQGTEFESVFAHHGADHPDTYKYLNYFNAECGKRGWPKVTVVQAAVLEKGSDNPLNLYDYCIEKKILPSMMFRWCTDKFKIQPVHKYCNTKLSDGEQATMYIGIASDEARRATPPQEPAAVYAKQSVRIPIC